MKQILINYLSTLNAFRNDINYYKYEMPGDAADGECYEGFQTNEPIANYCILSAREGGSLDHVISICSEEVLKDAYLLNVERVEYNPALIKLVEYAKKTNDVPDIVQAEEKGKTTDNYCIPHYDYFERTVQEGCGKYGVTPPVFHKQPISNEPSDAEVRNMIVTVGKEIDACVSGKRSDYRVVLDCTGGDRSAAVMMIALTKMLGDAGFNEIKLMGLNYNAKNTQSTPVPVREKAEMGQIFDLISGTRIFLSYGDSNALNEFFAGTGIDDEDEKALHYIQDFSDALKLCDAKGMHDRLRRLVDYINARQSSDDPLFEYVLDAIKRDFSGSKAEDNLLKEENITELNIISWCLRKGLIQQAVTFYAERIPVAFVGQKIIYYTKDDNWEKEKERYQNKWKDEIIIYENELHNRLIYEHYDPNNNDEAEKKKVSPTYFSESVKFFDLCVRINKKKKILVGDDFVIGDEYKDDPKRRELVRCIANYKEFRRIIRNGIMHANIEQGKMKNVMRRLKIDNSRLLKQTIAPSSIKLLMMELILQLKDLGMK